MTAEWTLPGDGFSSLGQRPFGVYIHIPWCASRCGYCDFNTYVPGAISNTSPDVFVEDLISEIRQWRAAIGSVAPMVNVPTISVPTINTVFFGGGTPTLLPVADLTRILGVLNEEFGIASDAEVTTEANPESVDAGYLAALLEGGFTRLSLGMQSAEPSVLKTLDRHHTPGRALDIARTAASVGFQEVSLDLIYGTPGETDSAWRSTLDAALSVEPTHLSAYSLIIEDGTRMGREVAAGVLPAPDDDVLATRYEIADEMLTAAGLEWYEVSNWARGGADGSSVCRHNMGYWRGDDWLGFGPGAHSHVNGTRWWDLKHPARYGEAVRAGRAPIAEVELLTPDQQETEQIMLSVRLAKGLNQRFLSNSQREIAVRLAKEGLCESLEGVDGSVILTAKGRLLADLVVRELAS